MLTTFLDNNVIYTEFLKFDCNESALEYIKQLSALYVDKEEQLYIHLDVKKSEVYVRIVKYNMWIKEPVFSFN